MTLKENYFDAAVLQKIKQPLIIKKLKFGKLKKGQVLVKIFYSGICRSQVLEVDGARGKDIWLPHLIGHEGSGVVEKIGSGVNKVKKGDAVILTWIKSDGIDALPAKYKSNGTTINSGRVATFSTYTVVSESRLIKKPKGLGFDLAVLFGCAIPTGMGMVINEIKPKISNSYAVIGIGGVGIFSILALKALRVKKIIAIDKSSDKLNFVKSLGIKHCLNSTNFNFKKNFLKITKQTGVDCCLEASGSTTGIELGFSLINKNNGQLLFASHPPSGKKIKIDPHELISGKKICGSWGGKTYPDKDIKKYHNILKNKIKLKKFVKIFKFNQINLALNEARRSNLARVILKMEH